MSSYRLPMSFAANVALITQDEELTFSQMIFEADAIARQCSNRSLIFLVASNTIPAVLGYVGCLRNDVVPIMLGTHVDGSLLKNLVDIYQPQYWWAPKEFVEEQRDIMGNVTSLYEARGFILLSSLSPSVEMHQDLALLLTTSGSTGTPKLVRLTGQNLAANAESIAEYQRISESDRAITTLPFNYSYGISIINSHLLRGASIVLTEEGVLSREFWNLLKEKKVTNFGGVPYTYSILEKIHMERMDLQSLRFISQAGGRLGERLQEKFGKICADKKIEFFVMYGQTEATARMSWLPPEYVLSKLGSIGIAIPQGLFQLIDSDGSFIEDPEIAGELVYIGANVSLGYAQRRKDLALPDQNNGVLHTGDVAQRDSDGFYYVVGRMKRFLKIYGNRVNLDEIEKLFTKENQEVACVGKDDLMRVFTTSVDLDNLRVEMARVTRLNPKAFQISHLDKLPRTSSGKLDYAALEKQC